MAGLLFWRGAMKDRACARRVNFSISPIDADWRFADWRLHAVLAFGSVSDRRKDGYGTLIADWTGLNLLRAGALVGARWLSRIFRPQPRYAAHAPVAIVSDGPLAMAMEPTRRGGEAPGVAVATKTRPKPKRPNMYRVLLLNDDYTPQEFVVAILQSFFNKSLADATEIMLSVHNKGVGECGVYTFEIAETKVTQVMDQARKSQHPLQCVMEKK